MYRSNAPIAVLLAILAAGCHESRSKTTSESVGGTTPTVSATASPESGEGTAIASPVTYEAAESVFHQRDYAEAARLFTAYSSSTPENPWGYYMLGLSNWRAGEPKRAVEAFDRALQLDPGHQKSRLNSSRVLLELGQRKEALKRIEEALSLEPTSSEGLRLLGRARYQMVDVDGAIEAYHHALVLDQRDVWAMNNLGLIYIEQGRSSEALPPLARAVELRSNSPVFLNNLGTALERSGHPVAAAKSYEAALAVDSGYTKASVSLARVTATGQTPDSEPADLSALSGRFQADIQSWAARGTSQDSIVTPDSTAVPDSTGSSITGLSDSSVASVEAVKDSVEDCTAED
jgi:tetratricopeptide (TPR) repeat protein